MSLASIRRGSAVVLGFCVVLAGNGAAAAAAIPAPLPTRVDLSPCSLGLPDKAPVVFPCGVIVTSAAGLSSEALSTLGRRSGAKVRHAYRAIKGAALAVSDAAALRALAAQPGIEVIPDRPVHAIGNSKAAAATTGQVIPGGVRRIGAAPGTLAVTGNGVGVAIVDTGLDFAHPDLGVRAECFDAFGGACIDANGHGTHVGGIVAARNNAIDVVGVASDAALYAVRVLDGSGSGSDSTLLAGFDWIAQNAATLNPPISVVNVSLGRPGSVDDNPVLHQMLQTLAAQGITVVAAAGNDATSTVSQFVPAAYPEVISVASTTAIAGRNACRRYKGFIAADTASYFTTDGAAVTISAPGEDSEDISKSCLIGSTGILSLRAGGGTTRMSGTSMAAPHVAGVAALLRQTGLYSDPLAIRSALQTAAARVGVAPLDSPTSRYTFDGVREGVLSACRALGVTCP